MSVRLPPLPPRWVRSLLAAVLAGGTLTVPLSGPSSAVGAATMSPMYWTHYASNLPIAVAGRTGTGVATATDPGGGVVAFGGAARAPTPASSGSTFVWDGSTWVRRQPATSPPPRENAAMSYDGAGHAVLFGGVYRQFVSNAWVNTPLHDTWSWDGATWTEEHPTSAPQADGRMAQAGAGRIVFFGGVSRNETWVWDGVSWAQLQPQHSPGPRDEPGVAPDAQGGVLLHGGSDGFYPDGHAFYNDTWRWDGDDWIELHPSHTPPSLWLGRDLALGADGRNLLLGCCLDRGEAHTWLWDGADWTTADFPAMPLYFGGAPMATDGSGRVVLADGLLGSSPAYTWVWQPTPPLSDIRLNSAMIPMATAVRTPYLGPLIADPVDAQDVRLAGVPVTFTLPSTGPSAAFAGGSTTVTVASDGAGVATTPALTANAVVGSFSATAAVPGGGGTTTFALRNTPTPVTTVAVTGTTHALYVRRSDAPGFTNLGGYLLAPPAVALTADGTTYYVGIGANHQLYLRTDRLSWRALVPQRVDCGQVGAAGLGQVVYIGCRGLDNRLHVTEVQVSGGGLPSWTNPAYVFDLGGLISSGPAVLPQGHGFGSYTVTAPQPDAAGNNVWQWNGSYYQAWARVPWSCSSQPAVSPDGAFFACRGPLGTLRYWHSGDARVFDAGGQIVGTPGIAAHATGNSATAYGEGTDGAIYTTTLSYDLRTQRTAAAPWRSIGGKVLGGVAAAIIVG